jgi:glycosyltransferase involved in cell wall biosynthesis
LDQPITFGIVTPTYKRANLVTRAVDSAISQTYPHWIHCVVDDCSPDDTPQAMEQYADNPKIHYIRQEKNGGMNVSRNTALDYLINNKLCDFIVFLDDDDYFTPDALRVAAETIAAHPDNRWFACHRVHSDGSKVSQILRFGEVSYFDNIARDAGNGDTTNIIAADLIGPIRFTDDPGIRSRAWHFFVQLGVKANVFFYDHDATIGDFLEDGITKNRKKDTKEEAQYVRNYEKKLLHDIGLTFEYYMMLKDMARMRTAFEERRPLKTLKLSFRFARWALRAFYASLLVKTGRYINA